MNTEIETAFEDARLQLGHIASVASEILQEIRQEEANPSVIAELKFQFLLNEEALIEHLRVSEAGLREVQILIEEWTAVAGARLQ